MEDQTPITIERLCNCGWEAAAVGEPDSYPALALALRKEATASEAAGDTPRARVLELLALICSLGFEPTNRSQPFPPMIVTPEGRSFTPDDLDAKELVALVEFGTEVTNGLLQARLSDLGWVHLRPRNHHHALRAIDGYITSPIDIKSWFNTGAPNWRRAIVLCLEVRKAARERLESIEKRLLDVVLADQSTTAALPCSLAELLRETGLARTVQQRVAERLEQDGRDYLVIGDPLSARDPLQEAANWYRKAEQQEAFARTTSEVANTLIAEGQLFEANATNGTLVATIFFVDAVEKLKEIPRRYRQPLRVDERIRELRQRITECNERGLEEMLSCESEPFDIARFVAEAQASVAGKSAVDALIAVVRVVPTFSADHWHKLTADAARKFPLSVLFPSRQLSNDGRIVTSSPGIDPTAGDSAEWHEYIHQRSVANLATYMVMCARGGILPALEALHAEHRFNERDFGSIASHSPIVPNDRAVMVGRGLYAGFNYDFAVAVHLLTPQIENIVRSHLRALGAQTRHMDKDGIENEVGLSSLMELPEATRIFGDLAFEIQTLYCEPTGFNLRNKLAHGLLNDAELHSDAIVFAWWFCLKLVMLPLIKASASAEQNVETPGSVQSPTGGEQSGVPQAPDDGAELRNQ